MESVVRRRRRELPSKDICRLWGYFVNSNLWHNFRREINGAVDDTVGRKHFGDLPNMRLENAGLSVDSPLFFLVYMNNEHPYYQPLPRCRLLSHYHRFTFCICRSSECKALVAISRLDMYIVTAICVEKYIIHA